MHPLKNQIAIDVDDQVGLGNLSGVRVEGRPIGVAFFDPRDPRVTAAFIDTWRSFGRAAGIRYVPHSWDAGLEPERAAKKGSDYITALEKDGKRRIDVVEWDIETHELDWQQRFLFGSRVEDDSGSWLKGIRGRGGFSPNPQMPLTLGYRWGRPGVWTMEGRQSVKTSAAAEAARTGLMIGPQCYEGSMRGEQWSVWYEVRTWCLNSNPDKDGATVPLSQFIPYTDADRRFRLSGEFECVQFATSRLTELVTP